MERFIDIIGIGTLGILSWQDFRTRRISWWLLPLMVGVFLFSSHEKNSGPGAVQLLLFNLGFISIQFLFIWIWFFAKNRKITTIINSQIGLGDVLFLVCLAFAFSPFNYLVFYTLGMTGTLLIALLFKWCRRKINAEIPLAGALAIPMIALLVLRIIDPHRNYYDDSWLENLYANSI